MIVLDTDHMSLLEWTNSPIALKLARRLEQSASENIATTVVNYEEQFRGWLPFLSSKKVKDQIEGYRKLIVQLNIYGRLRMLTYEEVAAAAFQRLKKVHRRFPTMDLKIAAIVLSHKATLLSRNLRDFRQIAGLQVEDWTKE